MSSNRAVTEITGATGMAIVRAIVAGDAIRCVSLRFVTRAVASPSSRIAEHLTGNWREEHLFNLASALRLFDVLEKEIASYEGHLLMELEGLQPPSGRRSRCLVTPT